MVIACWPPTAVKISVVTDLPCPEGSTFRTGIYVGGHLATLEQEADTARCVTRPGDDSEIGDLVIVPAEATDGKVVVQVVMNTDGTDLEICRKKATSSTDTIPKQCIVARRTFRFLRHTSRTLPVRLDAACRGKPCLEEETCINGLCQSSDVDTPGFEPGCRGCADAAPLETGTTPDADAERPTNCAGRE